MEMTKVTDIIANAVQSADYPSFDGSVASWKRLLKLKLSDEWVPALIRRIQTEGFNTPIRIGKYEPGNWYIGNGHHRLAVAIFLGFEEVPTTHDVFESWGIGGWTDRTAVQKDELPEDEQGAQKLASMVDTAIDWDNWPEHVHGWD